MILEVRSPVRGSHQIKIKILERHVPFCKLYGRIHLLTHSVCWLNSFLVLVGLRSLILISFLICMPLPASRDHPLSLAHDPFLHLQSQLWWVKSFSCFKSLPLLFLPQSLTLLHWSFLFKDACNFMSPPR